MVPLIGHQVWGLTEGKAAIPRWLAMASRAFGDLRKAAQLPDARDLAFWKRTGIVLVGPTLDTERFLFAPLCHPEVIRDTYVDPLMRSLGVPVDPAAMFFLPLGRTGALRALTGVDVLLGQASVDRMIVIAADSYLDGHSLEWLTETERLKSAEQPTGLMPGEAAVAILIHGGEQGGQSRSGGGVRVRAVAIDAEEEEYATGRQNGRALARAMTAVLASAGMPAPIEGDLYDDLNGESWRAYEFGSALAQISVDVLQVRRFITPAMSIGDVGAASTLLGVAVAARAFERGYARANAAIVTSMSRSGKVGAVLVGQE
jgi:3-oxoacyl-[acyl-carrier-protein] synthase-1